MIIGIDPSLSSTAITIYKNDKYHFYNFNNKKTNYKWYKNTNEFINYFHHKYIIGKNFSDGEVEKLKIYDDISTQIIDTISNVIDIDEQIDIYIEGYANGAKGKIIDLVGFSTLIRYKLLKIPNSKLHIIPPSSLKSYVGEMVYEKDKKGVYRNDNGKAAGSFDKKDMMIALLKLNINTPYIEYIFNNKNDLLNPKDIPKPFDDINDSLLLAYYGILKIN